MRKPPGFIIPSEPVLAREIPPSTDYTAEIKWDGWRALLYKRAGSIALYSRTGKTLTDKFPAIAVAAKSLPARSAIIDAELVSTGPDGRPDFKALMRRHPQNLTLWCFDLLHLNNKDLRSKPLAERRRLLQTLIERTDHPDLRYSEAFTDAAKLLAKANELKLEGTVLKRTNQIYKSGRNPGWLKIKTPYWYAHGRK